MRAAARDFRVVAHVIGTQGWHGLGQGERARCGITGLRGKGSGALIKGGLRAMFRVGAPGGVGEHASEEWAEGYYAGGDYADCWLYGRPDCYTNGFVCEVSQI